MDSKNSIKSICENIRETKDPSEFIGKCFAIKDYTGNTLDPFIEEGIVEILVNMYGDSKILDRFAIRPNADKNIIKLGIQKICLDTLSSLIVSNLGFQKINE